LAEIACGDFSGHHLRGPQAKNVVFACCSLLKVTCGAFSHHYSVARRQKNVLCLLLS
jgi:hypothetical protein